MTVQNPVPVFAALILSSAPAQAEPVLRLGDQAARLEMQARLEQFNANLLHHHSATAVLQAWCDSHGGGPAPQIVARRIRGVEKPADANVRAILQVDATEIVRYRRVELVCGDQVLSEADNWYRAGRLTPEMNRLLDETNTPFGVVASPLGFTRRNLSATLLFNPATAQVPVAVPLQVLRQSAVLATPDGAPLSLVVETYTREILRPRD